MRSNAFVSRSFLSGFLCIAAAAAFMLLDHPVAAMVCLGMLIAWITIRNLFKISVGCITMIVLCHSMRNNKSKPAKTTRS